MTDQERISALEADIAALRARLDVGRFVSAADLDAMPVGTMVHVGRGAGVLFEKIRGGRWRRPCRPKDKSMSSDALAALGVHPR